MARVAIAVASSFVEIGTHYPWATVEMDTKYADKLAVREARPAELSPAASPAVAAFAQAALKNDSAARPSVAPLPIRLPKLSIESSLQLGRLQAWYDLRSALPLLFVDFLAVVCALLSASALCWLIAGQAISIVPSILIGVSAMVLLFQHLHGLYPACGMNHSTEFRRTLRTCMMVCAGLAVGLLIRDPFADAPQAATASTWFAFLSFSVLLTFFLSILRPIARNGLATQDWWTQPVLILGSDERALDLYERLRQCIHEGLRPAGCLYDPSNHWQSEHTRSQLPFVGPASDLEEIFTSTKTCRLALVDRGVNTNSDFHCLHGIPHVMLPMDLGHHPTEASWLAERDGRVELHCRSSLTNPAALVAKRFMDLVLVCGSAPLWLPLMAVIAVCMKWMDPGPLFYKQHRVGRFRHPFAAIKFRSMVCNADQILKDYLNAHPEMAEEWRASHKLKDDPRITRIGSFLRKTSLDELPQLINVLRGEMSLVGPRPIIDGDDYDREYIVDHPEVFELYQMVQPGITGLWQISGRNSLPYKQRVALDRFYLFNWTIALDIFILWRTLKTAVFREGAY